MVDTCTSPSPSPRPSFSPSSLSVIDIASGSVVKTIPVGKLPRDMTAAPDGRHLYLSTARGMLVIDMTSGWVVKTFGSDDCDDVAVAPDGKHVYATCHGDQGHGVVLVIDTASGSVVKTIAAPDKWGNLHGVLVAPDGQHVYVMSPTKQLVLVIGR